MKKKNLKSLSFKKSNVANITGGLQDGEANQAQNAVTLGCPLTTITLTIHSISPLVCETQCCRSKCESWCISC